LDYQIHNIGIMEEIKKLNDEQLEVVRTTKIEKSVLLAQKTALENKLVEINGLLEKFK
jgi:hypothetical protein